jgi:ubiquinone/menaquinone biosynthesis C-methylase UbiE
VLVPTRRREVEILDDRSTPADVRERSLRDVGRSNALLGGRRAMLAALARIWPSLGASATLLDVGTGLADIPRLARRHARTRGVALHVFGLDEAESLVGVAGESLDGGVCGDVRHLPLADASVDVVTCSQLLHHFEDAEIAGVVRELDRVARRWVVISDLRRSWLASWGFWLLSWPLGFHDVTRHDGTLSVLRGFTADELARHVLEATGRRAEIRRHLGFRLTATWRVRAT